MEFTSWTFMELPLTIIIHVVRRNGMCFTEDLYNTELGLIDWLWWGETMSQNYGHQRAYCSCTEWYVSMESHGGDDDDDAGRGKLLTCPPELSGSPTSKTSVASRRNGRRSENFAYLKYLKGSLTCRKILRHGTYGFTSHPKEGVLRIFIVCKNTSPRLGLNPRPLGPVASSLTITPPRRRTRITSYTPIL
jgi:hypothetical protein